MNWHFRTLGMGTINYRASARRLAAEALDTKLFSTSYGHSENFMRSQASEFWNQHQNVLSSKTPGFGWWVWKPEFVLHCLTSLPEGSGLLYLDAGSTIQSDPQSVAEISNFMKDAERNLISASNSQPFIEEYYSSTQLMDLLEISSEDRKSNQFWAGCLFLVNCESTRALVRKWKYLCCIDNHRYLLPEVCLDEEPEGFIHHMHDQAILSSLLKAMKVQSINIGDRDRAGAIRGVRHRFGYSIHETRYLIRFGFHVIHFFSRVRLFLLRRIFRDSLLRRPRKHFVVE